MPLLLSDNRSSPQNHLVDEKKAAEVLGLKVPTLRRWRWAGQGPQFIKLGSAVRYHPSELERFIEEGQRRSTSDAGPKVA
jgi:predicted DNA-binding transcriptional regulator AlpA